MGVRTLTIASVLLALVALLALGFGGTGRAQEAEAGWTQVVPSGPGAISVFGLSPDWPRDPFLIVARDGLARTSDGGATWEALPGLPDVGRLVVAPAPDGGRIIFALAGLDLNERSKTVRRSTDAGSTWQPVLTVVAREVSLYLSPDFVRDGLAFVLADGQVHRSRDGGLVWERLDPAAGQRIKHLAFSPDVARDRTIFLAASNDPLSNDRPGGQADPGLSLGVLGSTDGGESWAPLPNQPEIEGAPYRQVGYLAVSPTFAEDGILAAFAWGPSGPATSARSPTIPNGALFLSRDRGNSWTAVHTVEQPARVSVAFSPSFAADGTLLLGRTTYPLVALSPGGEMCRVLHSADWGATWTDINGSWYAQDASCFGLHLLARGGRLIGVVGAGGIRSGITRVASMNGGRVWNVGLSPPPGGNVNFTNLVVSPGFAEDGAIFVSSADGGLWQYGPLPCPLPTGGTFQRLWESEEWVRDELGCPSEPERTVRVREGRATETISGREVSTLVYWPEDDELNRFRIWDSASGRRTWNSVSKERESAPAEPDAVLDGAIQQFERYGWMFRLSYPDGRSTILILTPRGGVHELPD